MLKLKKSELLDVKQLRRLCRLRTYDVLRVDKRDVVLNCVHHGAWDDKQIRVLADTAECPKCGKTRPHGKWSFSKEEWRKVLRPIVPTIKYVDKALVIEGRSLYKYKCRSCGAKFKNSLSAVLHPKFCCPECKERPSSEKRRKMRVALLNLTAEIHKLHKARDLEFYMMDLKAAYACLKSLGAVEYPPQIDGHVPSRVKATTIPEEPGDPDELALADPDDTLVKVLSVKVVPDVVEPEELVLIDDDEEEEQETFFTRGARQSVAIYAGRGTPIQQHPTTRAELQANYGDFVKG